MNNKQREEIITNAIKHITNAHKVKLTKGVWGGSKDGSNKKQMYADALGCVIIEQDEKWIKDICENEGIDAGELEQMAADVLKTSIEWCYSFGAGFDNVPQASLMLNTTAYKLGRALSKITNPIAYHIANSAEAHMCLCGECYDKNNPDTKKVVEEELEEEPLCDCGNCEECGYDVDDNVVCDCGDCDECGYADEED